jgi:hypothetical protein
VKTQNLKVKCRLRETDNEKHVKVQTKLLRLRLDAGLSSCEEVIKPLKKKKKKRRAFLG